MNKIFEIQVKYNNESLLFRVVPSLKIEEIMVKSCEYWNLRINKVDVYHKGKILYPDETMGSCLLTNNDILTLILTPIRK
jgi:hypothetical protein